MTGVGAVRLIILEKLSMEAGDWRASASRESFAAAAMFRSGKGGTALKAATPPFAPYELVRRLVDDLLGEEVEKEDLRPNEGRRSRSFWRTLREGLASMLGGRTPPASPELVPGRDLVLLLEDEAAKLLLLPPKKDEKKATLDVGVVVDCMSHQPASRPREKPPRNPKPMHLFVIRDPQFSGPRFGHCLVAWAAKLIGEGSAPLQGTNVGSGVAIQRQARRDGQCRTAGVGVCWDKDGGCLSRGRSELCLAVKVRIDTQARHPWTWKMQPER